jgi:mannose-1-phosphate guanylyltransferase
MTPRPRPRALVLAAGLGTRLQPLTRTTPKPLLPVHGRPILGHTLLQLAAAGCEAVAVNLYHHGEQIRRHFGDEIAGMPITWSVEPRLLGTLGALAPLLDFFAAADPLLIVNGDSLCRWPFATLLGRHRERDALATLLLATRPDPAAFGGGVAVGRDGAIRAFRGAPNADAPGVRRRVFAGAHVLSPRLLRRIAERFSDPAAAVLPALLSADIVRDLYEPLLVEQPGSLDSLSTGRRWHDLGTPRRFLDASLDWAGAGPGRAGSSSGGGRWVSPAATVSPCATVERSSVEAGCSVGDGALVVGSVLLPGARVGAGCQVRDAILGPGAELAAGRQLTGQLLVAAAPAGTGSAGGDTETGGEAGGGGEAVAPIAI